MAIARKPVIGGPKPPMVRSAAPWELEEACVARVNVVETLEAPGVALVGEKEAVHLLGSPAQLKLTAESNDPYCGVSWIV